MSNEQTSHVFTHAFGGVDRYHIALTLLREQENVHQREAPPGAPFRVLGPDSPKPWRKEVEKLAYYFKREMAYDFPPYTANEDESSREVSRDRVLVFAKEDWDNGVRFIGAVGVRWWEWSASRPWWTASWAWLHPYERRKGHLTKAWPFLLSMFPSPRMEPPLSHSMMQFLKKVDYFSAFRDYEI